MPIYIVEYNECDLTDSVGYFTDKQRAEQCCEYLNKTRSGAYYDYDGVWVVVEYNLNETDYGTMVKELEEQEKLEFETRMKSIEQEELAQLAKLKSKYETPRKAKWDLRPDGSGICSNCHMRTAAVYDQDRYDRFCSCCGFEMSID